MAISRDLVAEFVASARNRNPVQENKSFAYDVNCQNRFAVSVYRRAGHVIILREITLVNNVKG